MLVFVGWPAVGIIVECYGFLALFDPSPYCSRISEAFADFWISFNYSSHQGLRRR